MRDPAFYRWHAFVDNVFQAHKARLPPYTESQLTFPGIVVNDIQIGAVGGRANVVNTHWQLTDLNLTKGMDFIPRGDVFARSVMIKENNPTISFSAISISSTYETLTNLLQIYSSSTCSIYNNFPSH